jgi:tetratricopeptide (TPR) repeat protein
VAIRIKTKRVIIAIIVIVLVAAGVVAFIYRDTIVGLFSNSTKNVDQPDAVSTKINFKNTGSVVAAANKAIDSGEATSSGDAIAIYDAAIEGNTDPAVQVVYYISKSSILLNEKKYDEALAVAQEAEKLAPSKYTAAQLAAIYALKGDNASAIKQYETAIERAGDPNDRSNYVVDYYKQRIKELQ